MEKQVKLDVPLSEYDSLWEWTKSRSTYHFDKWRTDSPGSTFKVLGRFENTWSHLLEDIKQKSFASTWGNITMTGGGQQKPVSYEKRGRDIAAGGGDIDQIELTNITETPQQYPEFAKIIDYFHLEGPVEPRFHVQFTGQMFTNHIDPNHHRFAGPGANPLGPFDYDPMDIVRITIMLEDWEPGQFMIYGNSVYQQWRAGDFHMHDWPNVPHATANASQHSRVTLQLTGLRTPETDKVIGGPNNFSYHKL
jgi:hypothetical protein